MSDAVIAHLSEQRDAILDRLKALLRLPSVSTDPAYADAMQAARELLLQRLRTMGMRKLLGIDTLSVGLAMPDEDVHAPSEFFRLSSFDEGLRSWPMLLSELGTLTAADFTPFRH
jgi:acetylornithine deacetylase/succinyl-diaminopimelate desuccinylase-like protein